MRDVTDTRGTVQTGQARRPLRLGTRRSTLATTQSRWVAARLAETGVASEIVEVITDGDVNLAPLTQIGGTGVFASALRQKLREGHVDFAVHSLKDLPVAPEPGLVIAAIPVREDVRDVLISRDRITLSDLPSGASIGTGSPRRAAQLRVARPDLRIEPIRGNVETRIAYVRDGRLDAVILAGAGVRRLGLVDQVTEFLSLDTVLPAAGQGALAVECRADDEPVIRALRSIEHSETRACVDAERTLLGALEAGCTAPVGAYARTRDDSGDESGNRGAPAGAATADREAAVRNAESEHVSGGFISLDAFIGTTDSGIRVHGAAPLADAKALGLRLASDVLSRLDTEGARMAMPEDL